MPQPLPWFDNQIDPTLPSIIKAANYAYDEYGTYDVLVAEKIGLYIDFTSNFVFNFIDYEIVALIDRFTPWSYPWAEDYSTKAYNFIKEFTGTDYYTDSDISWRHLRDSFSLDFGIETQSINLSSYSVQANFTLQLPATQVPEIISITWLAREGMNDEHYNHNEFSKRYKLFYTFNEPQNIVLNFGTLLYCSIVVEASSKTKVNIENQFEVKSKGYLYNNLNDLFVFVSELIKSSYPRLFLVIQKASYELRMSLQGETLVSKIGQSSNYFHTAVNANSGFSSDWTSLDFIARPDYYRACSLFYANNNYWNNGIVKEDLGNLPFFYYGSEFPLSFVRDETENNFRTYEVCDNVVKLTHQPPADYFGGYTSRDIQPPRDFYYAHRFPVSLNNSNYTVPPCPGGISPTSSNDFLQTSYWRNGHYVSIAGTTSFGGFINRDLFNYSYAAPPFIRKYYSGLLKRSYGKKIFSGWVSLEGFFTNPTDQQSQYNVKFTKRYFEAEEIAEGCDFNSTTAYKVNQKYDAVISTIPSNGTFAYDETITVSGAIQFDYYNSYEQILSLHEVVNDSQRVTPSQSISFSDQKYYNENRDMPDSIRVKEIHAALNAQTFAYDENNNDRIANLGYYIERIARVLGISVNSDGTIRSIRQKKVIEKGQPIPAGWSFGQFGINKGGSTQGQEGGHSDEYRDGIVYEQRSNQLKPSLFNLQEIELAEGDYTLCENLPQYIDEMLDDLDKALGWQDLGAGVLLNADGSGKKCIYEGFAALQTELAYTLSRISQHSSQTLVATLIAQGIAFEVLKSTGQRLTPKTLKVDTGAEEYADVPYPGIASDAPSQLEQTGWILETIAPILGGLIKVKEEAQANQNGSSNSSP